MFPYADFPFFQILLLYVALPTVLLGWWGRANWRWNLFLTLPALLLILAPKTLVVLPEVWAAAGYALYQAGVTLAFQRWKNRATFYGAVALSILPLALSKFYPLYAPALGRWNPPFAPEGMLGFLGISYVTFRALDVIFSLQDRVVTKLSLPQFFGYLFFFPTISSGPIDRYRRFGQDWNRLRGRHEFLVDLDAAVQRVFQGFLYKFILAALIKTYWLDRVGRHSGFAATGGYMYAYTFYLFFDFAGYSAFAIGLSRLLGIRTPENFDYPFLARNIRDFWNRWHMSLSFWFRDHVYMRFLLAAARGKWFRGKHTSSYLGLFLTFGIMGVWHGPERHYLLYGLYHAALLSGYDAFARWNKPRQWWPKGRAWTVLNVLLTFQVVAFGLLIFSGRLTPKPLPAYQAQTEQVDAHLLSGFAWDATKPNEPLTMEIWIDDVSITRLRAGEMREELREQGYGSGAHGFSYRLPDWVHDGRPHTVDARVLEGGRAIKGLPQSVVGQE